MRLRYAAPAAALVMALGGCSGGYAHNLAQRELVVQFDRSTAQDQHREVLTHCSGLPGTTPEPLSTTGTLAAQLNNVRFRIDRADDAQINALVQCVRGFPFVKGWSEVEPSS